MHDEFKHSYNWQKDLSDNESVKTMSDTENNICNIISSKPWNVSNTLPLVSAPACKELCDELDQYLSLDPEMVDNDIMLWHEH